ncbi:MAG: hypothetical protein EOO65_05195, partial [Methanosarcinales archaeon]
MWACNGQVLITTVAGIGTNAFSGNGGAATAAGINSPSGVAALVDAVTGGVTLYIADTWNHQIRRVDAAGVITTVAGSGTLGGYGGDGGAATLAQLRFPYGLCAVVSPSSGTGVLLYIADQWNNRIRRVDEAGIISTIAGNGTQGFGGDGASATAAMLNYPFSVSAVYNTVSAGMLVFIADLNNHRIRRVDEAGIMTTVAGTGVAAYSGDGGAATAAALKNPSGVCAVYNP